MNARLRPCEVISRRRMISRPSAVVEDGFQRGSVLAGPDEVGRRPPADQQADGADDDGLAGAGLAGEDVQPGLELQLELIDHCQVAYGEKAKHESGPSAILSDV